MTDSIETELEKLRTAVEGLQAQRVLLGEAVVVPALQSLQGRVVGQIGGGVLGVGPAPSLNAGAPSYPLIGGVDEMGQVLVAEDFLGQKMTYPKYARTNAISLG